MDEISRPGGRADHYSRIRFYPHKIETLYQTLRVLIKFQNNFKIWLGLSVECVNMIMEY